MTENIFKIARTSVILLVISILVIISFNVSGTNGNPIADLKEGKNNFIFNQSNIDFTVTDLIELNPSISMVVYYDSSLKKEIARLNIFGGIGNNFIIHSGINYTFYAEEDFILKVPS
ncbi:MAG: hypothetical protein AABW89_04325 [Nanoarchaeota archaeon]